MPRIVTYNIRHCRGGDRRVSPARIAAVLATAGADVVALQEVDLGRGRTGGIDQAETIARALRMQAHFSPAMRIGAELYGDAILTAAPSRVVRAGPLPGAAGFEPRGAIWVELRLGGLDLQVVNTHLGVRKRGRLAQVEGLLGPDWLGAALGRGPVLLAGDLNSVPRSLAHRRIRARFLAAGGPVAEPPPATFPAWWPALRIDHVFAGPGLRITAKTAIATPLARIASDHLPLAADFEPDPA